MQPPLKNANGYRSPYINALNAAATANEVVAGDLLIRRTPQGTTLRVPPRPRLRRFRISIGLNGSTPVAILSDGNLILQTGPATLLPGKDVAWADTASPNPGWCSAALPSSPGHWLDFVLAKHIPTDSVYVVAQPGSGDAPDTPLHQLLPADLGSPAETDVAAIVTIGRVHIPPSTSSSPSKALQISQHIADDIPALGLATPTPFNHRFKVTAETVTEDNGNTTHTLHIAPGTIWQRDGDALAPIGLTPAAPLAAEGDGWTATNISSNSVYVTENAEGEHAIKFSDPDSETDAILLRIADVTVTTSDPPVVTILQRQIGDFVLADPAGEEAPVAWRVALRKKEVSSGTIDQWQIFAPTWTVGRETLLPEGMAEDWNDLDTTSGTLYAVLTWTGTATTDDAGEVQTTWTPCKPIITNDLTSIPADDDPTPDDPSTSTIEGKEGHRSIIVKIGSFITADEDPDPDNPDAEPEVIGFLQIHTGSIIEDISLATPAPAEEAVDNPSAWEVRLFEEEQENGTKKKVWKVWSPTFTAGNQTIYAITSHGVQTENGWNEILTTMGSPALYAVLTMEGTVSGTHDGPGTVTWRIKTARMYGGNSNYYYAYGKPPTRETPGIKEVAVKIGDFSNLEGSKWTKFTQLHTGSIVVALRKDADRIQDYDFHDKEPFFETAYLPVAFIGNSDNSQVIVHTKEIRVPIAQEESDKRYAFALPGGASDVLGPIEWDAARNSYVQYLGKWTWTGSAWTFAKKMNGNTAYPPAAIYPVTAANLLVRANRYGNPDAAGDNIAVIPFNLPFASAAATTWLSKRESTVSNGVVYTPPETVDGSGSLDSKTFTLTYWSDTGETNRQTNNLLDSIVEAANQTSTYEG